MANLQDFKDYYSNLLITQYKAKPKAIAHIELYVELLMANLLLFQIFEVFDIDKAVGVQLDILAKYVGGKRTIDNYIIDRVYFAFTEDTGAVDTTAGFSFDDNDIIGWNIYYLEDLMFKNSIYSMTDDELRIIIKFLILKNNSDSKFYTILYNLYNYFDGQFILFDNMDMNWILLVTPNYSNIIKICLSQNYFPRPIGVNLQTYISDNLNNNLFCFVEDDNLLQDNISVGFSEDDETIDTIGTFLKYEDLLVI